MNTPRYRMRWYWLSLPAAGLVALASAATREPPETATCEAAPKATEDDGTPLGLIWSGVNTGIGGAVADKNVILAAYYDADRYLTLLSYDSDAGRLCHKRLDSQFGGWDAHNSTTMAISRDGSVHVAGNAHASALVYARGSANDIGSVRLTSMVGRDETVVTYPRFLFDSSGNLLFLYRDGRPGNGSWLINRWNGKAWDRLATLFARRDARGPASAYPSDFVKGPDGRFHVAVVWRRTIDVATNFAVTYASTSDFKTWMTSDGHSVQGPLAPETMDTIDASGEGKGLVNNTRLELSASGQPIVLYTRYGQDGLNTIFAARRTAQGWTSRAIATARTRKEISGTGALAGLPVATFGAVSSDDMEVNVTFGPGDTQHLLLNPETLDTRPHALNFSHANATARYLKAHARGMADVSTLNTQVRRNGVDGAVAGSFWWYAQKANADRPRACTPDAPAACKPPASPLLWKPASP